MESIACSNSHTGDYNLSSVPEPLNLTSVNDDVKILIFEYLEWPDLLRVAETSKTLHAAACDVYKRKYGKGTLFLLRERGSPNGEQDICLWNPVWTLKFLRNFGHVTSHIVLRLVHRIGAYGYEYNKTTAALVFHIESYVEKYCSKSIRRLGLDSPPKFLFKEIQTSFINLENIAFYYYYPLCEVSFSNFPNLKSIELHLSWRESNLICIPNVKIFHIEARKNIQSLGLNYEENEIKELLKLNPQIEDLKLRIENTQSIHGLFKYSDIIFQGLNENLPMLRRLNLDMNIDENFRSYHFDNVIDFQFNSYPKLINIPFTFSKLERFTCSLHLKDTIESCVFDFIAANECLKSITLDGVMDGIDNLFQLNTVLTSVEEMSIKICRCNSVSITSDLILNLFSQSQSLKRLTLTAYPRNFENLDDSVKSKIVQQEKDTYRKHQVMGGGWLKLTFRP
ncbi:uncharacterized protein LOC129577369 isoform X1 [Sitodiplosis mosellana]|uniref:uncharacterized protein LOC129577369 isoform X1 n=1 Tax=Sitodiplosis mosellana TaxID=263140 RepID=UPI0024444E89|nr:uncharacterized protein LOC129577369 isoform X1 [Sitodiplosis mosellana]